MNQRLLLSAAALSCLLVLAGCAPGANNAPDLSSSSDRSSVLSEGSGSTSAPDVSGGASGTAPDASGPAGQPDQTDPAGKRDAIPFSEGQSYAVAHLGYQQIDDLDYYIQNYLDSTDIPMHLLSSGDFYLIIPRYEGMELSLFQNDFNTSQMSLFYQQANCQPFILQCNVSDIFPDATIRLTYQGETVEFSPFISLKDGSLDVGEHGLDLTKGSETAPAQPGSGAVS